MAIGREDWRLLSDVPKDRRPWPYHQWNQTDWSWHIACWGWGHPRVQYGLSSIATIVLVVLMVTAGPSDWFGALVVVVSAEILAVNVLITEVGIGRLAARKSPPER